MPRWQVSMTSAMLVAMTPRWKVRESPTLIGMVGSCGATPPASKRMTRFGACSALGQHGGGAGHAGADGDGAAVLQQAGGTADHQFHRVVHAGFLRFATLIGSRRFGEASAKDASPKRREPLGVTARG